MVRAQAVVFQKVFRFSIQTFRGEVEDLRTLTLMDMRWDGPHLVLTRGMQREPRRPSLAEELADLRLVVNLLDSHEDAKDQSWEIKHAGIRDRGFLFMNAAIDDVALEAVCLLDAELVAVTS